MGGLTEPIRVRHPSTDRTSVQFSPDFSIRLTKDSVQELPIRPIRVSDDSSFSFVVFGFDLIFKVWFVSMGLVLPLLDFD